MKLLLKLNIIEAWNDIKWILLSKFNIKFNALYG